MKKYFFSLLTLLAFSFLKAQLLIHGVQNIPDVSKLATKPNIILILADDLSYNTLNPDRGPAFLQTPNINRIAEEGIRFKNSFVTFSLCEPSRAQLLTGYYPHITGVITGGAEHDIPSSFITLPQIMKANGYRTGFVGKYQVGYYGTPRPGWDYWFSFDGGISSDNNDGYYNTRCNLNGVDTTIACHMTDAITNFTSAFLESNTSQQPFFLIVSQSAPHWPYEPQIQYDNLYQNEVVPFTDNFYRFAINYPSYLYPKCESSSDLARMIQNKKNYYELVHGIDTTAKVIFDYLIQQGFLKKTMIIFTSDNGLLFGEHRLRDKQLAYEESIRVPLYIRYPPWFNTHGRVDYKDMALNLDLFTTILDAAGIADTFNTHGISLHLLANDSAHRNLFMYERNAASPTSVIPTIRAVRSLDYKYVKSYCTDSVEEFFDLKNDPHENTNQIFNPAYASVINRFRISLDSLRLVLNDTAKIQLSKCRLENVYNNNGEGSNFQNIIVNYDDASAISLLFYFEIPPNSYYSIYDAAGQVITSRKHFKPDGRNALEVALNNLRQGIYFIKFELDSQIKTLKFVKTFH